MKGTVYCILYRCGTVKIGFTAGHPRKRIAQHVAAGRSFGMELDVVMFTEGHEGARRTESIIVDAARSQLTKRSAGVFEGGCRESCRKIMLRPGLLVGWSDFIDPADGAMMVSCGSVSDDNSRVEIKNPLAYRIEKLIRKNGRMTIGVIRNRFRTHRVDAVVDALVESGVLREDKSTHGGNGSTIKYYSLAN